MQKSKEIISSMGRFRDAVSSFASTKLRFRVKILHRQTVPPRFLYLAVNQTASILVYTSREIQLMNLRRLLDDLSFRG